MIEKVYGVICDNCSSGINYWFGSPPTKAQMLLDGIIIESKVKHFCSKECYGEYKLKFFGSEVDGIFPAHG